MGFRDKTLHISFYPLKPPPTIDKNKYINII